MAIPASLHSIFFKSLGIIDTEGQKNNNNNRGLLRGNVAEGEILGLSSTS